MSTTTPTRSPCAKAIVSSAIKTLSVAKKELEDLERDLEPTGGSPPSPSKFSISTPDTDAKENCASSSKQLGPNGAAKEDSLLSDFDKLKKAATPTEQAKSPDSDTKLASKVDCFTRTLKEMNANGGRTPTKVKKDEDKVPQKSTSEEPSANKLKVKKEPTGEEPSVMEKLVVGKEVNTEEDILFQVKAKPFRLDVGTFKWVASMSGTLKLYRNKTTGKTRLVQRNIIGTVKLNLAIGDGMFCLEKVRVPAKKKRHVLQFYAVADEKAGVECFRLQVKPEKLDILYKHLKEMGAEAKQQV